MIYLLALVIGIVAGLRTMTAPAAIGWGAQLGWLHVQGTWAAFMGSVWAVGIFTLLALVEFVADPLPQTPSRTVPMQFGARLVTGGFSGAALGAAGGSTVGGLVVGIIGAVLGTLGGAHARGRLAAAFGRDLPAALVEDAVGVVAALAAVRLMA